MDLLILTSALDRSVAAITSATDTAVLSGPDDFPQLVLGTTEPMTVKHLSAASTYETWSYDPTYTVKVALGNLTATGLDSFAEATLSTVITNQGKSGNLSLTTARLASAMSCAFNTTRPGARVVMTLQVTVTDPSGNNRVFAQLPVSVRGTVPSFTQT